MPFCSEFLPNRPLVHFQSSYYIANMLNSWSWKDHSDVSVTATIQVITNLSKGRRLLMKYFRMRAEVILPPTFIALSLIRSLLMSKISLDLFWLSCMVPATHMRHSSPFMIRRTLKVSVR